MLRDDINNAVKEAMKAKEERKLSTLRMVNSTIKNADIEARGQGKPPLSDDALLSVLQKMIKQRQEAVELYDKGGRAELAAQEREEIAVISAYLPELYEPRLRCTGAAVGYNLGGVLGGALTPVAATALAAHGGRVPWGVGAYLTGAALLSLACFARLPETRPVSAPAVEPASG